jgi:hypothetical protein
LHPQTAGHGPANRHEPRFADLESGHCARASVLRLCPPERTCSSKLQQQVRDLALLDALIRGWSRTNDA